VKALLSFIFVFALFFESGVNSVSGESIESHCETVKVEMNDCHDDLGKQPVSSDDCECDCHIGHNHNAVVDHQQVKIKSNELLALSQADILSPGNSKNFHSQLNRPPIILS
jgi:hypothetical protein